MARSSTTYRRHRPAKLSTSIARCFISTIRCLPSRRHHPRRSTSCRRRSRSSWCCRHRRRRSACSCCRCRCSWRYRSIAGRRPMSGRRRTTSSSQTSTTGPSSTTSSTIAIPRRRSSLAGQREQAASRLPRPCPRWRRRCRPPRHSEPIWSSRRHNRAGVNQAVNQVLHQVLHQVLAASRQRRPRQRPRRARRPMPPQHGPIPALPASPRRLPPVRMRCRAPMDNRCQRLRPRPPRRRRRRQPYLRAQEPLHHQLPSP